MFSAIINRGSTGTNLGYSRRKSNIKEIDIMSNQIQVKIRFKERPTDLDQLLRNWSYFLGVDQEVFKGTSFYPQNTRFYTVNMVLSKDQLKDVLHALREHSY